MKAINVAIVCRKGMEDEIIRSSPILREMGLNVAALIGEDLLEDRDSVKIFRDFREALNLEGLKLIMDLRGDKHLYRQIEKHKPEGIYLMDSSLSDILWNILLVERDRLLSHLQDRERLNNINRLLRDTINLSQGYLERLIDMERRLEAEKSYMDQLIHSLPESLIVINSDYIIESVNHTFLKEWGKEKGDIVGKRCHEVIFGRPIPCQESFCPFNSLKNLKTHEIRFKRNGREIFYELRFNVIFDDKGNKRYLLTLNNITKRKRIEREIESSQKRYRSLFENARDGIVIFNGRGEIIDCNLSLLNMLGYRKSEILRMRMYELSSGVSQKIFKDHLNDLKPLRSVRVELELSSRDREGMPVEANINYMEKEDIFQAILRDIRINRRLEEYRKNYSQRLEREVEERTKELMAAKEEALRQKRYAEGIIYGTPIPMFVLNRDHKITFWNRACEQLTGYKSEEMIGTDNHWMPFYPHKRPLLADLVMEEDTETMKRLYKDMKLRESPLVEGAYEAEYFFPHLGDGGIYLYFNAAPIKDEKERIQGAIVTYQDLTERVRMTEELKRREAFSRNLIQNSIDGIIATERKGKIVIFNESAKKILGYRPDEIIGKMSYRDILSKEMAKRIVDAFYSTDHGPVGKIINMEVEMLNREGEPIPVRLNGTLLYQRGKEAGSVVFIQDLRELLKLQKEKEEAKRMAAIGETVSGLAHYIKNILNGLKGGAYVINSGMNKKDMELVSKGWKMVEKNIDHITNIVLDMLIYSRDRKPQYKKVNPNQLVMEVINLLKDRAEVSNVQIRCELSDKVRETMLDPIGIHRCLLNLISNAIDACTLEGITRGKGMVTIRTEPENGGVRFDIIDNGIGMDEEVQKRLFKEFFTTKGYKGTGLGLPVTHKIVKEHHGKLTFKSSPGKGTTFTMIIPERKV